MRLRASSHYKEGVTLLLLIEDDEAARKVVACHFQKRGLDVVCHETGEAALQWLLTGPGVDLVICDFGLPGMSGVQVVEALRAQDATARVPVILCSSGRASMLQDHALAIESGADAFFQKPYPLKTIEEEARRLLPAWVWAQ